ncbi:hypothetical protein LPJ59_001788 [Coemansia sp. RSA 2399]|nr:hypothetical protein LPJ59_001788 [Coemansia sp. RSA 2399]
MDDGSEASSNDDFQSQTPNSHGLNPVSAGRNMPDNANVQGAGNGLGGSGAGGDVVVDNGRVDGRHAQNWPTNIHANPPPQDRHHALENLASLADVAAGPKYRNQNPNGDQRRIWRMSNGRPGFYRSGAYRAGGTGRIASPISPLMQGNAGGIGRRYVSPSYPAPLPPIAHTMSPRSGDGDRRQYYPQNQQSPHQYQQLPHQNQQQQHHYQHQLSPQPQQQQQEQPQQPPSAKRPTIRIKPFAGAATSAARDSIQYPLSAGSLVSGGTGMSASTTDPVSSASATPKLSEEQETWIKESHSMLQHQNTMLSEIQRMMKEMNAHPTREAKKAMSTISSLSALVSSAQPPSVFAAANGAEIQAASSKAPSPDMATAPGSSNDTPVLPQQDTSSPPQFPKPALSVNQLYSKSGASSAKEVRVAGSSEMSSSLASASPANIQLPKNAMASSTPQHSNSNGLAERDSLLQTDRASRKLVETQTELDELKANVMYLIKRVNIAQILLGMLKPPRQDSSADGEGNGTAFTALVEDLKQLGTMSKDNLHEYMKVFVRNLEATEGHSH